MTAPPPNSPTSPEPTNPQQSAQPAAYCPVEDLVHTINEFMRVQREIFENTSIASMQYLLSLEYRKFKRIK